MTYTPRFVLLAIWLVPGLSAQSTTGGMTGTNGSVTGSSPTGGQTPVISSIPVSTGKPPAQQDFSRPIFLSGKVVMDDGSPVPSNVTIQRLCGGNARTVAYTDSRGNFNFQWNKSNNVMADASEAGSTGRGSSSGGFGGAQSAGGGNPLSSDPYGNQMIGCELRANSAGFRSDSVNLAIRNAMDNPDIGTLFLHRMAAVEGLSVSATSLLAPKDAKKAYDKGRDSLAKNKPSDAAKEFEKAVETYPKYADAWMSLGVLRLRAQEREPAREALLKAIEADPKLVQPYVELGMLAAQEKKWDVSSQYLDRAVRLNPVDFPQAWYGDAVANFNLKKYEMAERSAREAVKLDTRHVNPRADYLLGLVLLEKRDYPGAAAELKTYLDLAPNAPDVAGVKEQLNRLQKVLAELEPPRTPTP